MLDFGPISALVNIVSNMKQCITIYSYVHLYLHVESLECIWCIYVICVADIRGGGRLEGTTPTVWLDHLVTSEAPASPTLTTQRRSESSSPENALHIVHIYLYS